MYNAWKPLFQATLEGQARRYCQYVPSGSWCEITLEPQEIVINRAYWPGIGYQVGAELRNVGKTSYTAASFIVPEKEPSYTPFSYRVVWDKIERAYWVLLRGSQQSTDFDQSITVLGDDNTLLQDQSVAQDQNEGATDAEVKLLPQDPHDCSSKNRSNKMNGVPLNTASIHDAEDIEHAANTDLQISKETLVNLGDHLVGAGNVQLENKQDSDNHPFSSSLANKIASVNVQSLPDFYADADDLQCHRTNVDLKDQSSGDLYKYSESSNEDLVIDQDGLSGYLSPQFCTYDEGVTYVVMGPGDRRKHDESDKMERLRVSRREAVKALQSKRPKGFEWLKEYDADPRKRTDWVGSDTVPEAEDRWEVPMHHRNLLGQPVDSKHQTLPQTSAWAFFADKVKYWSNPARIDPCSRKAVVRAQAWKWIDPFISAPNPNLMGAVNCGHLRGTAAENELTGAIDVVHSYEGWWPEDFYDMDDIKPLYPHQANGNAICHYDGGQPWLVPMFPHLVGREDGKMGSYGPCHAFFQYPGASPLQMIASTDGQRSGLDNFVSKNPGHEVSCRIKTQGADVYQKELQALSVDRKAIRIMEHVTFEDIEEDNSRPPLSAESTDVDVERPIDKPPTQGQILETETSSSVPDDIPTEDIAEDLDPVLRSYSFNLRLQDRSGYFSPTTTLNKSQDDNGSESAVDDAPLSSQNEALQRLRVTSMSTDSTNDRSPVFEDPGSPQSSATSVHDMGIVDPRKAVLEVDASDTPNLAQLGDLETPEHYIFTPTSTQHDLMQQHDDDVLGNTNIPTAQSIRFNAVIQSQFSVVDHCLSKDAVQHQAIYHDKKTIKSISPADVWTASDFRFRSKSHSFSFERDRVSMSSIAQNQNDQLGELVPSRGNGRASAPEVDTFLDTTEGQSYLNDEIDASCPSISIHRHLCLDAAGLDQENDSDTSDAEDNTFSDIKEENPHLSEEEGASYPTTPARHIIRPCAPTPGRGRRTFPVSDSSLSANSNDSLDSEYNDHQDELNTFGQHSAIADAFVDQKATSRLPESSSSTSEVPEMEQIILVLRPKSSEPTSTDLPKIPKEPPVLSDDDENEFDEDLFEDDDSGLFEAPLPQLRSIPRTKSMPTMHGAIDTVEAETSGLNMKRRNYEAPWLDDGDDEDGLVTVKGNFDPQMESSEDAELRGEESSSDPGDDDAALQQFILDCCCNSVSTRNERPDDGSSHQEANSTTFPCTPSTVRLEALFGDLIDVAADICLAALDKLISQQWDSAEGVFGLWNLNKFVYATIADPSGEKVFKFPHLVNVVDNAACVAVQLKATAYGRIAGLLASRNEAPEVNIFKDEAGEVREQAVKDDKAPLHPNSPSNETTTTKSQQASISDILAQTALDSTKKSISFSIGATLLGPRLGWKAGKKTLNVGMAGLGLGVKLGKHFLPVGA